MAIINQYKAIYPVENSRFENENVYINATSMEKAVNMITIEKGTEPKIISKIYENVLTEPTEETTVNFKITSYYIDFDTEEEIEIDECVAYPTELNSVVRGSTIYMQTPNYTFTEDETIFYSFSKWIYNDIEYTNNPQIITVPLDESITEINVKAIYTKTTN